MALLDNVPSMGYIYIQNLVITYNEKPYVINNLYTNKKYIYWNLDNPFNLYCTDIREEKDGLFFIIKNNNGNSMLLSQDNITFTFDGYNAKNIIKKIKTLDNKTVAYKKELEDISNKTEELSDEYKKDKDFNEIKENLNTSIINYNSLLINLSTTLDTYLEDGKFTSTEKGNINYKLENIKAKSIETLAYADALIDLACIFNTDNTSENDINTVYQYKVTIEELVSELITNILEFIDSDNENVTLSDMSIVLVVVDDILTNLSNLKNSCNTFVFLGAGGTISDEMYDVNTRLDESNQRIKELQDSILNDLNDEKQEIQQYFNSIRITLNKMITITNEIRHNNGVLNSTQYKSLGDYEATLKGYVDQVTGIYEVYYSNNDITDTLKKELNEAHNDFILQYKNFSYVIKERLRDNELDSNDGNTLTLYLNQFRSAYGILSAKIISCINLISNKSIETSLTQIRTELEKEIENISNKYNQLEDKYNELKKEYETLNSKYTNLEQRIIKLEG